MPKKLSKEILPLRGVRGVDELMEHFYNQYAFIDGTAEAKPVAGEAEDEAIYKWKLDMERVITRTYESPFQWYLVVFKPFNKPYLKDSAYFSIKGIDKCRKLFKRPLAYIFTRETEAKKVHINAIVLSDQDLNRLHDQSYCSKYKLHVQQLHNVGDRQRALAYITKEHSKRTFTKYLDYLVYSK